MSLISSIDDAQNFSMHPVKAYDPFYTRDIHLFKSHWDDFEEFLRGLVASNSENSQIINMANNMYYEAIYKCRVYEKATGFNLISLYEPNSPLHSLYDVL